MEKLIDNKIYKDLVEDYNAKEKEFLRLDNLVAQDGFGDKNIMDRYIHAKEEWGIASNTLNTFKIMNKGLFE